MRLVRMELARAKHREFRFFRPFFRVIASGTGEKNLPVLEKASFPLIGPLRRSLRPVFFAADPSYSKQKQLRKIGLTSGLLGRVQLQNLYRYQGRSCNIGVDLIRSPTPGLSYSTRLRKTTISWVKCSLHPNMSWYRTI